MNSMKGCQGPEYTRWGCETFDFVNKIQSLTQLIALVSILNVQYYITVIPYYLTKLLSGNLLNIQEWIVIMITDCGDNDKGRFSRSIQPIDDQISFLLVVDIFSLNFGL